MPKRAAAHRAASVPRLPALLAAAKREGWHKWVRTEADERAVLNGCRFSLPAARRVTDFFAKFLRHSKGQWAGQPFELLDWQRDDLVYPLFGWLRADGTRRFRQTYIEIPKKNGKSTIASGVGLYLLVGDGEAGAEVYSAAADQKQASIVHDEAINMVKASPVLDRHLTVNLSTKNIAFPGQRSYYRALSGEAANKEGLNAHGLIADELHVWHGRGLWDTLRYAFAARRQPLLFAITTAGDDMTSVCREQHDFTQDVLKGVVKGDAAERHFGYIRAAGEKDDLDDPAVWHQANPSLGVTIDTREFGTDLAEARTTPAKFASFKRYRFNLWTTSSNPWLPMDGWAKGLTTFTAADLKGRDCWGGLDLSQTRDMTAFVLVFPDEDGGYRVLPNFWLPEDTANDLDPANPYRGWAESGHLKTTPGNVVDYAFVKEAIAGLAEEFRVVDFGYDPYNAEHLVQELQEEHALTAVSFAQTVPNFAEPTAEFERLVIAGKLRHNGHPILSWQAGHVQVRTDANNNRRPVKPRHGDRKKIDGIVAAVMALGRARSGDAGGPSVYETRGIIQL